jgi:hypothetical protein
MLSTSLLVAAGLTFLVGAAHSWLGERKLIGPLLAPEGRQGLLARSWARTVLRFAWHLTTIAWWGSAATFAALAGGPLSAQGRLTVELASATFLVTGVIVLVTSRGRHLAWPVFLIIAVAAALPAWR